MDFRSLIRKAGILVLIFIAGAAVFLVKNDQARESLLEKLQAAMPGFYAESPADNIDLSEIDFEKLGEANESAPEETPIPAENKKEEKPQVSEIPQTPLIQIEQQVAQIAKQTEEIRQEVNRLTRLEELAKELETLDQQLKELSQGFDSLASGNLSSSSI